MSLVFVLLGACMWIGFLTAWIRNFRASNEFARVGFAFAIIFLAVDLSALFLAGSESIQVSMTMIVFLELLAALKIYIFSVVGLLMVDRLAAARRDLSEGISAEVSQLLPNYLVPSRSAILSSLAVLGFMLIYSSLLFHFFDAQPSAALQHDPDFSVDIDWTFASLVAVAGIGFAEEIMFRLGLQNGLAYLMRMSRYGQLGAIVVTSAVWTLGHAGVVDPEWVKMAQIFVIGLVLGGMNWRFGVVPCMVAHMLFNVIMVQWTPTLMGY